MDPITAITTATAAFNTVKRMVQMGRDVEDTLGQIGKWYGAISDLNEAERIVKNPPLFKKIVAGKSVEQEAMDVYAAQKRAQQQEKELRELLLYTYGPQGYQEMIDLRRRIRDRRERTIYAQARRRKNVFWLILQSGLALLMSGALYQVFMVLYTNIQAVNNA